MIAIDSGAVALRVLNREWWKVMHSDLQALELPAFELDCRDWLVATPDDGSVPEDVGGAPVVAMLSTVVIGAEDLLPGSALLSVGLLDEPGEFSDPHSPELLDVDVVDGSARYVVPSPNGKLALLAEFSCDKADDELMCRFDRLMASFRWTG